MRNFKELKIWQNGMNVAEGVYKLVDELPNDERYGLKSQLSRAAVSIPSNISEGGSRSSQKEYRRFLEFALGSCFELETQLIFLTRINMATEKKIKNVLEDVIVEQKMISGLINKLAT